MLYCQNCGYQDPNPASKYCYECGSHFSNGAATPQMQANPVAGPQFTPPVATGNTEPNIIAAFVVCVVFIIIALLAISGSVVSPNRPSAAGGRRADYPSTTYDARANITVLPEPRPEPRPTPTPEPRPTPTPRPSANNSIVGSWVSGGIVEYVFYANGTFSIGQVGHTPDAVGRYRVRGNTLYLTDQLFNNGYTWIDINTPVEFPYRVDGDTLHISTDVFRRATPR